MVATTTLPGMSTIKQEVSNTTDLQAALDFLSELLLSLVDLIANEMESGGELQLSNLSGVQSLW